MTNRIPIKLNGLFRSMDEWSQLSNPKEIINRSNGKPITPGITSENREIALFC
jgi:hypothetical protein